MEYKKCLDFFTANVLMKMREGQTTCFLHFVVILKYTEYGKQGHVVFLCWVQVHKMDGPTVHRPTGVSEFCFSFCHGKEKGNTPHEFDFQYFLV